MSNKTKDTFRPYESINNHYAEKAYKMITEHPTFNADAVWSATEKVHGCNFSMTVVRGSEFKV
jgi:hypothetical protein